jgi:4'-phosphopantetheinyl transferase
MAARWLDVPFPPSSRAVGEPEAEVHVWLLELDQPEWLMSRLRRSLDARERARASALVFPEHRDHYTAAHGLVRQVLAGYLGVPAAKVVYRYGQHGKPNLFLGGAAAALRFNASRSANLALCAIALDRDVGVDIERIRVDVDQRGISERYFSTVEHAAILALPPGQRVRAFYDCWTRKEAQLKATGDGLSVALDSFEVPVTQDLPPAHLDATMARQGPVLTALPPVPGFAAALAACGDGLPAATYRLRGPGV